MVYIGDWNEEKGRVAVVNLTKDCRYKKVQFINMDVTDAVAFESNYFQTECIQKLSLIVKNNF